MKNHIIQITPITRKKGDMYELDLTLRNNKLKLWD